MHDIKAIRENPASFDTAMARRNILPLSAELTALDEERRAAVAQLQVLQAGRNALAKRIGEAKRAKQDTASLEAEGATLRGQMEALEAEVPRLELLLRESLAAVPNVLEEGVPEGRDETANQEIKTRGARRNFSFAPKQHFEIGEALGLMDFAAAAKIAGSRFTVLRGGLARLERALGQFMLDLHVNEHGYTETMVPLLVNDAAAFGTGQLPKFREDLFQTTDGRWLHPHRRSVAHQPCRKRDFAVGAIAAPRDGAHPLLPLRGRLGRARRARHAAPAPVHQGGAGQHRAPGGERGGA